MARYFSAEAICEACQKLKHGDVSATDLSALRYCFAFDAFVKETQRDCSLKKGSPDRDLFLKYIGDIVCLDVDNNSDDPSYICDYNGTKPKKPELSSQVSSNFFTANAVRQSRGKSDERYPSGADKYLFTISDEVLNASSINYEHIARYLRDSEARAAFAIWLTRYDDISEDLSPVAAIKDALGKRYSLNLVNALLCDVSDSLHGLDAAAIFGNSRPTVTWKLLFPDKVDEKRLNGLYVPRNWIFFGAPGTGKSYQLNRLAKDFFLSENVTRVTFYPDYTYSQFIGCFKPITKYKNDSAKPASALEAYISYEFVPGPFLEVYVKAVQNPDEDFLLIVEEINRANPAAVFGDVFQLLDRDADGRSEYEVTVPREMRDYLSIRLPEYANNVHITDSAKLLAEQGRLKKETERLSLPPNMYIWATMNSADQGIFPMDTAFKRRWDFRYMGIDEGENTDMGGIILSEIKVPCGGHEVVWNNLRHAINEFMASEDLKINEDKLLGPFFIAPSALTPERFGSVFKDKVLLYLYEDAGRTKRSKMFRKELNTYAKICKAFDENGIGVFGNGFDDNIVYNDVDDVNVGE